MRQELTTRHALILLALTAALAAQRSLPTSRNPDANDLNDGSFLPLMSSSCRLQQFYEASELGASSLLVSRLLLRYDAQGAGSASPHTIQQLTLRVGATARGVATLGSAFDANLSAPLTTVYQQTTYSYLSDGAPSASPKPFGGPGAQFRFVLGNPVTVLVPSGGAFVLEVATSGNSNGGQDGAKLDFHLDASASQGLGAAITNGRGCATGPTAANGTLETIGAYQPGTPLLFHGSSFPPSAPVVLLLTAKTLGSPLALPLTTPICWIYLDGATGFALPLRTSDPTGSLPMFGGDPLPIPKTPGLCGAVLYVQGAAPTPQWSGNSFGVLTSNYRTIVLGCPTTPQVGAWYAASNVSSTAGVATLAMNGGLAVRVE